MKFVQTVLDVASVSLLHVWEHFSIKQAIVWSAVFYVKITFKIFLKRSFDFTGRRLVDRRRRLHLQICRKNWKIISTSSRVKVHSEISKKRFKKFNFLKLFRNEMAFLKKLISNKMALKGSSKVIAHWNANLSGRLA